MSEVTGVTMWEETSRKALHVRNLSHSVFEDLLRGLFSPFGTVKICKIIRPAETAPYAFVEFTNPESACVAFRTLNKSFYSGKKMFISWAKVQEYQPKSYHKHILVNNLYPNIETETLRNAFAPFGEIKDCYIIRESPTARGVVSFVERAQAENAKRAMHKQLLGSRLIHTLWSSKPQPPRLEKKMTFNEIYNQTSPTNTSIYFGGYTADLTAHFLTKTFSRFGEIQSLKVFKERGYAFIRFATKASATRAIEKMRNKLVNGHLVKCFWANNHEDEGSDAIQLEGNANDYIQSAAPPNYNGNWIQPGGYAMVYQITPPVVFHGNGIQAGQIYYMQSEAPPYTPEYGIQPEGYGDDTEPQLPQQGLEQQMGVESTHPLQQSDIQN